MEHSSTRFYLDFKKTLEQVHDILTSKKKYHEKLFTKISFNPQQKMKYLHTAATQ